MNYKELDGDLITLALEGKFDVIAHGCNCFCTMGAGIAPQMAKMFGCDKFPLEDLSHRGDINKLGNIDYKELRVNINPETLIIVINAYTQYGLGTNHIGRTKESLDYDALRLCMRKINKIFKGKHIGLPRIGCGLGGGSWSIVSKIIRDELWECDVTIVNYKP